MAAGGPEQQRARRPVCSGVLLGTARAFPVDLGRDVEPDSDTSVSDAAADGQDLVMLLRTVTRKGAEREWVSITIG